MCDYSRKLVAWLDRELASDQMVGVEQHIHDCAECRRQVHAYQQMTKTFDAYCDSVMATSVRRGLPRWVPALSATAVAAVAAALFLAIPRAPVASLALPDPVPKASQAIVLATVSAPIKVAHRRHAPARVQSQNANWLPTEPAIQITIPAESMFPPGAVPEGVNFTADVSLAADGSAQQIRLRPRLIGFERRATQP